LSSFDQPLVGSIALVIATAAAIAGVGPWDSPYQLRTFAAIDQRYGRLAARLIWIAIAAVLMTMGLAIISGWRPSYVSAKAHGFGEPHEPENQVSRNQAPAILKPPSVMETRMSSS
jgi:Mg2+/citrate symporter